MNDDWLPRSPALGKLNKAIFCHCPYGLNIAEDAKCMAEYLRRLCITEIPGRIEGRITVYLWLIIKINAVTVRRRPNNKVMPGGNGKFCEGERYPGTDPG
jgi:hypothetical protein